MHVKLASEGTQVNAIKEWFLDNISVVKGSPLVFLSVFPHFFLLDPTWLLGKDQIFFFGEQGVYEKMKQSQSF